MSNFHDLLIKRRSIRKFISDEKLSPEETQLILEAALLSPTSKNSHSWEFIVVEDKKTLEDLSYCKPNSANLISGAALAIVVIGNPLDSDVWIEDASIAAMNIQLQAEEMGIGSCWVQVRGRSYSDLVSSVEYINELLGIPMPLQPLCIIALGKKIKDRTPNDINNLLWEKVHINRFNFED